MKNARHLFLRQKSVTQREAEIARVGEGVRLSTKAAEAVAQGWVRGSTPEPLGVPGAPDICS